MSPPPPKIKILMRLFPKVFAYFGYFAVYSGRRPGDAFRRRRFAFRTLLNARVCLPRLMPVNPAPAALCYHEEWEEAFAGSSSHECCSPESIRGSAFHGRLGPAPKTRWQAEKWGQKNLRPLCFCPHFFAFPFAFGQPFRETFFIRGIRAIRGHIPLVAACRAAFFLGQKFVKKAKLFRMAARNARKKNRRKFFPLPLLCIPRSLWSIKKTFCCVPTKQW